jgi:O-antigen/teichoic acid export membrane protein
MLIPQYGALGAAIGTCITVVIYKVLNHLGLRFATAVNLFDWRYLRVYASIVVGTAGLSVFQYLVSPPIYVGLILAGLISLIVLVMNRKVLDVKRTFPELLRFPLARLLFATDRKKKNDE